jgi:hypothetical protein
MLPLYRQMERAALWNAALLPVFTDSTGPALWNNLNTFKFPIDRASTGLG